MKLRESSAVLLIIGSAVVGPIEPFCESYIFRPREEMKKLGRGMECAMLMQQGECERLEKVAETCARAMKEIGVRPHLISNAERDGKFISAMSFDGGHMVASIICIPAPSGLKR